VDLGHARPKRLAADDQPNPKRSFVLHVSPFLSPFCDFLLETLKSVVSHISGVYDPAFEQETVHTTKPPAALFIDEYFKLTLKVSNMPAIHFIHASSTPPEHVFCQGKALLLNQTVITARRHALSKVCSTPPPPPKHS
jgi:hypothetical protein